MPASQEAPAGAKRLHAAGVHRQHVRDLGGGWLEASRRHTAELVRLSALAHHRLQQDPVDVLAVVEALVELRRHTSEAVTSARMATL